MNAALAIAPKRLRLYALLSQALRAQGNLDGALTALQSLGGDGGDPAVGAEWGLVLAARGDLEGAGLAWRQVLARDPVHPTAFGCLAALAMRASDADTAQSLIDAALAAARAHPDVLRRAIQLALANESEGIARASRVARLCGRLIEIAPDDAWAALALAKSLLVLGDRAGARARLVHLERSSPQSAPAAEAQLVRLAMDDPAAELELQTVLRASRIASRDELRDVTSRARRLATLHGGWLGWFAVAVAERRRGRLAAARAALNVALESAPGATSVHVELADVLLLLDDPESAAKHAEAALALEGESARGLVALARAQAGAGRIEEAASHGQAGVLAIDADNAAARGPQDELRECSAVLKLGSEDGRRHSQA